MTERACARPECDRKVVGRGLCRMHYLQEWRAGTVAERPTRQTTHRECAASDPDHRHAHDGCWLLHGCRCSLCTHSRRMERQRRRNRLRAYGQEERIRGDRVPAGPARQRLDELMQQEVGLERIADAAGVPRSVLLDLRFGRRGVRSAAQQRELTMISREHSELLLALDLDDVERAIVPATGTVRRLQALVCVGWTQSELADRIGMQVGNFSRLILGYRPRVTASTAQLSAEMFAEMWSDVRHGARADRARRLAASRSWVGPLGWDDIDSDPAPADDADKQTKGDRAVEDVEWLLDAGEPVEQIATTIGRSLEAITKLLERHGRSDLSRPFGAAAQRARNVA